MTETINLDYPIEAGGQKIDHLQMRRPKVKDLKDSTAKGKTDADRELQLFARLTDTNPEDLEELDLADYQKLQNRYSDFLA